MTVMLGRKVRQLSPGRIGFHCPGCNEVHQIVVDGSRGWSWNGDGDKPTVTPSILVTGKRRITEDEYQRLMRGERVEVDDLRCHSFVVDGQWQFLTDCTHALAGKTVEMPDYPVRSHDEIAAEQAAMQSDARP
jgi:hypothetical protein